GRQGEGDAEGDGAGGRRHTVRAAGVAGAAPHGVPTQGLRLAPRVPAPRPARHLRPKEAKQHDADDAAHGDPRMTNVLPGVPAAGAGARGCDPRDDRDPVERVEEALQCLAPYDPSRRFASANEKNPFLYWKILDFAHACRSGITTPSAVAEHVIAGVEEWNNKKPPMPMLIYFDAHDLTKQADASTKRFEQGSPISGSFSPLRMTLTASHIHQRVLPHFSTKSALWRKTQS
uniref:Uncharacterized protein n=1 Tax=Aegilops tauschii subsp. strangulata TaxID=200361 RepID=A0A452XQ20_AEGTS